MDVIFCMNVLIYFSEERRRALVQRFYDTLEPGGYLFLGHSESISKMPVKFQAIVLNDCILYRKPTAEELQKAELVHGGTRVSMPDREAVEMFLQEASEHLQYLREYVSVLQEIAPRREDLERLYISAHTLSGTSASYGFPRFSEIAGKLAHVFQYATERDSRRRSARAADRISFRRHFPARNRSSRNQRHRQGSRRRHRRVQGTLSFRVPGRAAAAESIRSPRSARWQRIRSGRSAVVAAATGSYFDALPADDEVPDEILEFFQPEAEEHLQIVSDCLISLEGNNNPEEINKLFRAIHTVKGSAAQVGLKRLGAIAHRVEDLIGRLRDGEIEPSPADRRSFASNPSTS